jgi:predicted RNase H-like nuclease (RuvC/YqgF family)
LNLKKDKKKNLSSKFELKNMLEEYYKNNNLEYSRRNDINNYTNKIEELKTTKDSTELTNVELLQKNEEFKEHLNKIKEKNKFFEKAIDKKITNITLENFEKQFIELQLFSK